MNDHTGAALHEEDSERVLLSGIIEGGPAVAFLLRILQILPDASAFSSEERRRAWSAVVDLYRRKIPISPETVEQELRRSKVIEDPKALVMELITTHSLLNANVAIWHAQQVRTAHIRRTAADTLQRTLDAVADEARDPKDLATFLGLLKEKLEHATMEAGAELALRDALISAERLSRLEIPPRRRLLDEWLCEADLGFIFAPRGVGKTWFAMALPKALSQGLALGNWRAGEQRVRVLYVDGEMPLELTRYRSRGMKLDQGDLTYLHHELLFTKCDICLNIGREEHRRAITRMLVEERYECLVLDNLSSLASGIDENKGDAYEPIANWLLELRRRKITVIVVHHAGRNAEVMRGHTKREDACSWIIQLRDAKTEGECGAKFVSHFAKPSRNTGNALPDLLWHFTTNESGDVVIHCEAAEVSDFEAFIQLVFDGVETQADIAEQMGKPKGTISKWAKKAWEAGRIRREGNRLLPPSGPTKSPHQNHHQC